MKRFFLFYGFTLWLVATAAFRVVGHYFLQPGGERLTLTMWVLSIPLLALLTYPLYKWKKLDRIERRRAAIYIALPGQLLDAFTTLFFPTVFPNMSPAVGNYFGALMLWGYAVIIMTGFIGRAESRVEILPVRSKSYAKIG